MRPPHFWQQEGWLSRGLAPLGCIYSTLTLARMARSGYSADVPVICIGNLTLGGAGKTPLALAIGGLLRESGQRVMFLSRGYGGRLAGPVILDPDRHTARDVGDEPLLLAMQAGVVVARDRAAGARLAQQTADVLVMDDGFQSPALNKDLSLLVVDAGAGWGNGRVFPAGPLRADVDRQLRHAHGVVLIFSAGDNTHPSLDLLLRKIAHAELPVFRASLVAEDDLSGLRGLAYCGIGRDEKFFSTLTTLGAQVMQRESFADHHPYSDKDAQRLLEKAHAERLVLMTTAKDAVRLAGSPALETLRQTSRVVAVRLVPEDSKVFQEFIVASLRNRFSTASGVA